MADTQNNIFLCALHAIGFSQRNLMQIIQSEVKAEDVYEKLHSYSHIFRFSDERISKISQQKNQLNIQKIRDTIAINNIQLIGIHDKKYPELLKQIPRPPTLLYIIGNGPETQKCISIVGSRKHSAYSMGAVEIIASGLIDHGYHIVSGGAYGLDSVAHSVCVGRSSPTHVILGSGIDMWYPRSNTQLFKKVIETGGSLISQFPLGEKAEPYNFPIRNELVAGISRGVLVAEAGEKGGTLITARLALEANRDVFVIPADITRVSARGSNQLISSGLGKLVQSASDIIREYEEIDVQQSLLENIPQFENVNMSQLYQLLCENPLGIDEILEDENIGSIGLSTLLSKLEVGGYICRQDDGKYRILR